jgi:hypothetical protein
MKIGALLAVLVLGAIIAFAADDVMRYRRIRNM